MQSVADKVVERQGVVGPATYPPWQGEAARFVRQARAVDRSTKAARAAAWVVIPPDRLRAHEPDLVKRGFHVLGQVLRVDHLTASERVELANYLDLTERQKTEYMLAGFASPDLEAREDALLATCPRYTSTGFELDLPDGLKRTHQGRAALLEAGAKIKAYLQRDCPGWRLEWAWSSSCPHRDQGTRCPALLVGVRVAPQEHHPRQRHRITGS